MTIWNEDLTPDQIARKLAHSVLVDNTQRIQDQVLKDEKKNLITMQSALDIMTAWNDLVAKMAPD